MTARRIFLRNATLAMAGAGRLPLWLARALSAGETAGRRKVLVAIFLRGAADGLNVVIPHGDPRYYSLRPSIGIPRGQVIDLDGFFGLHPALAPLKPVFDQKRLAIVHAAGSPDPTRSHFDAQDYMESGTPGVKATRDGWLNRALAFASEPPSPLRAVSIGAQLPRSLRGASAAVAIDRLSEFRLSDTAGSGVIESLYSRAADPSLRGAAKDTFAAISALQSVERQPYQPANGAAYPASRLGESLRQIACLIKADLGLEVAFAEIGGWDHHANEVAAEPSEGALANLLAGFGKALAAFDRDLDSRMEDIVVVTLSEFGRTARENGSRGTDHGHANCIFLMGAAIQGGRVAAQWPGLDPGGLYEGRDLAVTTDFRDVLGELVARHLGKPNLGAVFPGYPNDPARWRGLIA